LEPLHPKVRYKKNKDVFLHDIITNFVLYKYSLRQTSKNHYGEYGENGKLIKIKCVVVVGEKMKESSKTFYEEKLGITTGVTIERTKLNLTCSDDLWDSFKGVVPKNKTMNRAVLELILEAVKRGKLI